MGEKIKTFELDNNIHTLWNYFQNTPANFHLYKNCTISDCIRRGWRWEEHQHDIAQMYLNKNSISMEVGSHIGTLTVMLSKLTKKVYAFEPVKDSYDLLIKNLTLNNCNNVETFEAAVGNEVGITNIEWVGDNNSGATVLKGGDVVINDELKTPSMPNSNVKLVTIDSLNINELDYLKVDVEGFEENVIDGALKTIKKCQPLIIIECMEDYSKGTRMKDNTIRNKFKYLLDLGYTYDTLCPKASNVWDVLFKPKRYQKIASYGN